MFDPTTYAMALYEATDTKDYQVVLQSLNTLAKLQYEYAKPLQSLQSDGLSLLKKHMKLTKETEQLLMLLVKNRNTSFLPRIASAFSRQLEHAGFSVIEVATSDDTINIEEVAKQFGAKSIILHHYDDSLIQGMRITTNHTTYEYSTRTQLQTIKEHLLSGKDIL